MALCPRLICLSEQNERHRFEETLRADRFIHKRFVCPQRRAVPKELVAIPGEVEDLETWLTAMKLPPEFIAPQARHHEIGQKEIEGTLR